MTLDASPTAMLWAPVVKASWVISVVGKVELPSTVSVINIRASASPSVSLTVPTEPKFPVLVKMAPITALTPVPSLFTVPPYVEVNHPTGILTSTP